MRTPHEKQGRLADLLAAVAVAACGLVWRMAPLGLPAFWLKYGGSALWGAMVLLLVAACARRAATVWESICVAVLIAVASELFRLFHAPALDAFRLTLPGALLLGRVFNGWNVVAYGVGIVAAMPIHWLVSGLASSGTDQLPNSTCGSAQIMPSQHELIEGRGPREPGNGAA